MPKSQPRITVIIPHLNQEMYLQACLAALDRQTLDRSRFEVIVVDNGSTTLPATEIGLFKGVRLLQEPVAGPGPARNRGVRESISEILAFTDADCQPHPDWLSAAVQALDSSPVGTLLGGDIRILPRDETHYTAVEAYESIFGFQQQHYIESVGFSVTANLILRREDFERTGPFAGIDFAEDMDFGERARRAGCAFQYVPNMVVFHPARGSFRELCVKWDRHLGHFANMAQNRSWWRVRWTARALAVLCSTVLHAFKIFKSDRIQGIHIRLQALRILVALRIYRTWRMVTLLGTKRRIVWNSASNTSLLTPKKP
jgi:GT2 family glycosyltransferase